jgi:hypothetical protein
MTMAAAGVLGPVVRMCDNPRCEGVNRCDRVRPGALFGLADAFDPVTGIPDDAICAHLRQELSLSPASDSAGVQRMVPDGCEFTVHKTPPWLDAGGRLRYDAIYSGPASDRDEALAGVPEWDHEVAVKRLKRMHAAGMFDAARRWRAGNSGSAASD